MEVKMEKPAEYPAGLTSEEKMTETHLGFLMRMMVIVIVKVKIIIKKR
jgi:hypothetical protein